MGKVTEEDKGIIFLLSSLFTLATGRCFVENDIHNKIVEILVLQMLTGRKKSYIPPYVSHMLFLLVDGSSATDI